MRLKKFLRSQAQAGQITTEYFVLLCVIATITIIGSSRFFSTMGTTTNRFMSESVAAMAQNDLSAYPPDPTAPELTNIIWAGTDPTTSWTDTSGMSFTS